MDKIIIKNLIEKAMKASENSYSPYSNYKVGASLLTKNGEIFTGTNIENASYGLSMCAERVAVFNAISSGYKNFLGIAIYTKDGGYPCGNCLQVLEEFAPKIEVIVAKSIDDYEVFKLSELLPHPFQLNKNSPA